MSAIIDIQCVLEADNKYMIKEMSVVDTETVSRRHIPHVALVNIEDLGCPRLDQICGGDVTLPCCIFHMEFNPKQCTFYKVFAIRKWL
ncbi:Uncharacterized protein FWK35_00009115, partial [Aphis craccivora]